MEFEGINRHLGTLPTPDVSLAMIDVDQSCLLGCGQRLVLL